LVDTICSLVLSRNCLVAPENDDTRSSIPSQALGRRIEGIRADDVILQRQHTNDVGTRVRVTSIVESLVSKTIPCDDVVGDNITCNTGGSGADLSFELRGRASNNFEASFLTKEIDGGTIVSDLKVVINPSGSGQLISGGTTVSDKVASRARGVSSDDRGEVNTTTHRDQASGTNSARIPRVSIHVLGLEDELNSITSDGGISQFGNGAVGGTDFSRVDCQVPW